MPIVGTPRAFDKKFGFQVEIDGFFSAGFMKASALECEIAEILHYEGGTLIANKSAGRLKFPDLVLERGATQDLDFFVWFAQVANAPANVGVIEALYKRHLDIIQLDRDGRPLKRWSLFNAWPKKATFGMWDNTVDENVVESLTLAYDYFIRTL